MRLPVLLVAVGALGPATAGQAMGASPAAEAPLSGKRVVQVNAVPNVVIELPNGTAHDFGDDFAQLIENALTLSGRYIYTAPASASGGGVTPLAVPTPAPSAPPDYEWNGTVTPAAVVSITVEGMSFQTGSGGDRMFYGFNERFRTPFNPGTTFVANEFPLRDVSFEPNWFDASFNDRGVAPFDSQSGLDLGDGFQIDALFAWLAVKYASYEAELHLKMDVNSPLTGIQTERLISVSGTGFFYDIVGAYEGYSAGISVARTDAMGQAFSNAITAIYTAIDASAGPFPLTARIDGVAADGTVLLGTGPDAAVVPGTEYRLLTDPTVLLQAIASNTSGTMAKLVQGPASACVPGVYVVESTAESLSARVAPVVADTITVPPTNFPQAASLTNLAPVVSWAEAVWESVVDTVTLAYRIARYYEYDQAYQAPATPNSDITDEGTWSKAARAQPWAHQIGLDVAPDMSPTGAPIVAVIDSGIDYNHWALHDHIWVNPAPTSLPASGPADQKDTYGWDFISGDSNPFDDAYHGTEVASLVAAVAPASPIMALKSFNPWGITSSAALYGAIQYAVDHGAKIIVCGWATRKESAALAQGVAYAGAHAVAVIAAAGDRGDDLTQVAAYPAALSLTSDNLLAVAGVTTADALVTQSGSYSNFAPTLVGMAAPGLAIQVATPGSGTTTDTSTALAAGITAGALARLLSANPTLAASEPPSGWLQLLRAQADSLPALDSAVAGGLRLHVRQ